MTADIKPVTLWRPALRKDAEIERLRADKLDLEAALEYTKSHKEITAMNQHGIIKALSEIRDEYGVEIHKLRAEVKSLQTLRDVVIENHGYWKDRAERLEEALRWYVENDDTNERQEGNEYWLAGRDRAIDVLSEYGCEVDNG